MPGTPLPGRSLNPALTAPDREVILVETVPCAVGDRFSLTFESAEPRWRQGVWLAVDGTLDVEGQTSSQVVLWQDTSPEEVVLEVTATGDGLLRFYNVWDSGRGTARWESQKHSSGMVSEAVSGRVRYRCSDIRPDPTFDALVFTMGRR